MIPIQGIPFFPQVYEATQIPPPPTPPRGLKGKDLARWYSETALKHYDLAEFAMAAASFRAGYEAWPDAVFLFNLGQCHRLLGDLDKALFYCRAYLRKKPDAANREQVLELIKEIEETTKTIEIIKTPQRPVPVEVRMPPPAPEPTPRDKGEGRPRKVEPPSQPDPHFYGGPQIGYTPPNSLTLEWYQKFGGGRRVDFGGAVGLSYPRDRLHLLGNLGFWRPTEQTVVSVTGGTEPNKGSSLDPNLLLGIEFHALMTPRWSLTARGGALLFDAAPEARFDFLLGYTFTR